MARSVQVLSGDTSLSLAVKAYLDNHVEFSPKTIRNYRVQLNAFIRQTGDIRVWQLDEAKVRRYFFGSFPNDPDSLRARVAPGTFNQMRMTLRSFIGWLVRIKALPQQLVDRQTVPKATGGKRPSVFLTPAQIMAAIEWAEHPRDRILLAMLANTGIRESELTALRLGDVKLDAGKIHMRVSKGGKRDEMPITADLDRELRRWLIYYTEEVGDLHARNGCVQINGRGCGGATKGLPLCAGWFLVPAKNAAWITGDGQRHHGALKPTSIMTRPMDSVGPALEAVGVRVLDQDGRVVEGRGTGCHTFRRSAANALFDHATRSGGSEDKALVITQAFLHHTSLQTTQVYLNKEGFVRERDEMLTGKSFLDVGDTLTPTTLAVAE